MALRRIVLGRIVLLVSFAVGCCRADSLGEALRSGRFGDALTLADELLKAKPQDPKVWTGRGIALAGLRRDGDSLASFEHALRISPNFAPALKAAAEAGYRSRDPRTIQFLHRLLRLEPGNAVAHGMAGVLAFEAGDCARALPHLESIRGQNDQVEPIYGACLVAAHRAGDAVPVFARIGAAHPESPAARFNLGYVELLAHRYGEARKTLEPLAAHPTPSAEALNLLAAAEAGDGRIEPAVAYLQRAIRTGPQDERNYLDLAALCMQNESADTAATVVDTGLRNLPQSARLHTIRGVLQAQLGRYDEAVAEFDLANRLDTSGQYGAAGLGVLYTELRRTEVASELLRERLRPSPSDPTLNFLLAQSLVQERVEPASKGFREAIAALKRAIAAKPDLGRAHSLLGKLYAQSGDDAGAVAELRLGARYAPLDRMAHSHLIVVLRRLGRNEEAAKVVDALKRIIAEEARPKANYQLIRVVRPLDSPR